MGERSLDPNWRFAGRLLPTALVCEITGWTYSTVIELVRSGVLIPSLGKKPYKFDPEHIYQVFFAPKKIVINDPVRSLKTEEPKSKSHKPVTREDLWKD